MCRGDSEARLFIIQVSDWSVRRQNAINRDNTAPLLKNLANSPPLLEINFVLYFTDRLVGLVVACPTTDHEVARLGLERDPPSLVSPIG